MSRFQARPALANFQLCDVHVAIIRHALGTAALYSAGSPPMTEAGTILRVSDPPLLTGETKPWPRGITARVLPSFRCPPLPKVCEVLLLPCLLRVQHLLSVTGLRILSMRRMFQRLWDDFRRLHHGLRRGDPGTSRFKKCSTAGCC